MSAPSSNIRVEISAKRTLKTRTDFAGVVAKQSTLSPFVLGLPSLKAACDELVTAGADLAAAETNVRALQAQLAEARSQLRSKQRIFDAAFDLCAAQTERHAKSSADVEGVGFSVRERAQRALVAPLSVAASFNLVKQVIEIDVKQPEGMRQCMVEISPDPAADGTWLRLDGTGLRRKLSGYAPGMYWVRAANVRASTKSEYTAPVAVVVK